MPIRRSAYFALACLTPLAFTRAAVAQCAQPIQQLVDERKFDDARNQAVAALTRSPADDRAAHCVGRVLEAMQRPRDALPYFEKAEKLNDLSALHHLWVGNTLGDLGDSTSKLKLPFLARRIKGEFERAVELDPHSVDARNGLIQFYVQAPGVMGGSLDKAKEQAREIGKFNSLRGHFAMADILSGDKKEVEAEAEYLAATRDAPDSSVAWFTLASFYVNHQKWSQGFDIYDRMLKQFVAEPMVHFQIGRTAALSGQQLERGETELKGWLAAPPKNAAIQTVAGVHHRLGMIYEKQGRKDLAREEYTRAIAIDSTNKNAKKSLAALK